MNKPITTREAQPNDLEAFWMPFTDNRQFKSAPRLLVASLPGDRERTSMCSTWTVTGCSLAQGREETTMTTEPDPKTVLQTSSQPRGRRQALKVMGAALAGSLPAFLWPRFRRDRQDSAVEATKQRPSQTKGRVQPVKGPEQAPGTRPNILFIQLHAKSTED